MKKNFLIIITVLLFQIGKSQVIDLSEWKRDSLPLGTGLSFIKNDELYKATLSKKNWSFKISNDTVKIENNHFKIDKGDSLSYEGKLLQLPPRRYIRKVFNGYLIGLNDNEYIGNSLKFLSNQNNTKLFDIEKVDNISDSLHYKNRQLIASDNIRKIFKFNKRIYAFQGGGVLDTSPGLVIEIFYENGKWNYKPIKRMIEVPEISFLHNDNLYMITNQYIFSTDKNMQIKQVLKSKIKWGHLNLSNAFIKKKDIYIAMRKGILIIRDFENNPNYEWFVK